MGGTGCGCASARNHSAANDQVDLMLCAFYMCDREGIYIMILLMQKGKAERFEDSHLRRGICLELGNQRREIVSAVFAYSFRSTSRLFERRMVIGWIGIVVNLLLGSSWCYRWLGEQLEWRNPTSRKRVMKWICVDQAKFELYGEVLLEVNL